MKFRVLCIITNLYTAFVGQRGCLLLLEEETSNSKNLQGMCVSAQGAQPV